MRAARSQLRDWPEYLVIRFMLATMAHGPFALSMSLGRFYASILDKLVPRLRRVAQENLTLAMPALDEAGRQRIIDGVFKSIGRILATFARFPSLHSKNVGKFVRYEGFEHVQAAMSRGKGVLFATGHLGNWEISALAFSLMTKPMHIVVRPLDNPLIDRLAERYRGKGGNTSINKREFARAILERLHQNEMVGILVDQHVSTGIPVNFFGVPAATSNGLAKIAARSGAAVIPGFALWSETEKQYVLRFYPETPISGDAAEDTQRVQRALEAVIREYPDQWLWIHRRWKSKP